MKLSTKDLIISAFFIITLSTIVSNIYRPIWGYVYAIINLIVLSLISIFMDSWSINKK